MAMAGMRFNNGYATSATCTPSRYALLTGVYPWREKRANSCWYCTFKSGTDQMTLPKMLKQQGYQTALSENGIWVLAMEMSIGTNWYPLA